MKIVLQKHKYGCGISCIATILSKPYDSIISYFSTIDFDREGLIIDALCDYLGDNGFTYIRKYLYRSFKGSIPRDPWPCDPFAPIHILHVDINSHSHFVIMDKKGKIFCPANIVTSLVECKKFYCMAGFYKI